MKKYILIFIGVLIISISFIILLKNRKAILNINGQVVYVSVADNPIERTKGLMFRKKMREDMGMWFVFEKEEYHSFWMKNTYIPLDIFWVDSDFNVVHISKDTPPCESDLKICTIYKPDGKAKYVLELNGGWSDKYDLNLGDKILLEDYVLFVPLK